MSLARLGLFGLGMSLGLGGAVGVLGAGCSSSSTGVVIDGGNQDVGLPEDYVPIPKTEKCKGGSPCLSGTVSLKDFKGSPTATKVTLYRVFPHGSVQMVSWVPVALDGTFAFSGLAAWSHYYLQAEARFGVGTSAHSVASLAGSFTAPSTASIPLVIRPVFLEVLQQTSSGMPNDVAWASAHLYDPKNGEEVTSGTVTFTANGMTVPMTYGTNAGGEQSFFVALPSGTMGGTAFQITTSYAALGSSPVTWNLAGQPATFQGSITAPAAGTVPANMPLVVSWTAEAESSYAITELFVQQGSSYTSVFTSPTVNAPDVTTETIPASNLATAGAYLLNVSYANATCPPSAEGCVYNVSTAAENLTVQ